MTKDILAKNSKIVFKNYFFEINILKTNETKSTSKQILPKSTFIQCKEVSKQRLAELCLLFMVKSNFIFKRG